MISETSWFQKQNHSMDPDRRRLGPHKRTKEERKRDGKAKIEKMENLLCTATARQTPCLARQNTLEPAPRALKRLSIQSIGSPQQIASISLFTSPILFALQVFASRLPPTSPQTQAAMAAAASDLESKAKEAFVDDDFELAAELYTQAIEAGPATAELYADRAQANIKLGSYTEAVADANKAIELDPSMHKAYLRKGSACIKLEEYQTAKAALEVGSSYASGDSRFTRLMKECDERIAEEASHVPVKSPAAAVVAPAAPSVDTTVAPAAEDKEGGASMENAQPTVEVPIKPKYRHDYYNSTAEVVLTIFAKGVPADSVVVDFGEQMLSVSIELPGEEPYHFQPRLFSKIIPEKCKYSVLSTKVEIRLAKAEQVTWTSLDYKGKPKAPQKINAPAESAQRPSYPSSKPKKDWDKLEAEVKKQEKDEKLDGDAALNKFFREIYSDADEDMRRAMMKSFVESNGTVLSTNWKDVGKKPVEGSPPDGMELKKWEY